MRDTSAETFAEVRPEVATAVSTRPRFLSPFGPSRRDEAVALLMEGFPATSRAFWEKGLDRQEALQDDNLGYFLEAGGQAVGVMLTLRSTRSRPDGTLYPVVNLSSWYIQPAHRWRAVPMLRAIVAESDGLVTDLTASESIYRMNAAVGLEPWSNGMILAGILPWAALPARRGARVLLFAQAAALLGPAEAGMLEWHERDGLIAAVLCEDAGTCPLLFRPIRRKGVRFAQLIFAGSRKAVIRNLPTVTRFLAGHGILFLSIDAYREDCPRGAVFRPGRQRFWRGEVDHDRLDYAYSELVLFGVS
ncbi:hypothetical protein [Bosea beijingensis]|uniref:hypothetical protein n=1 Tax=Bosea beijingensis TaxID=3068632 RepID=UPI0027413703|nr:hypothetical protein [Bosea sp. REN20]